MRAALELTLFLVAAFALSALLAHFIVARRRRPLPTVEIGANLRLRGSGGMYRAKLLGIEEEGWTISCPLSRNSYVPLRIQDRLTVEAPVANGVMVFRTEVTGRDDEAHHLVLGAPVNPTISDRRQDARKLVHLPAKVESERAELVDVSPLGARLVTDRTCHVGERVRVEAAETVVYAWVLDFWPTKLGEGYRETIRVRFEEIVTI